MYPTDEKAILVRNAALKQFAVCWFKSFFFKTKKILSDEYYSYIVYFQSGLYDSKKRRASIYNGIYNERRKIDQTTAEASFCERSVIELTEHDKETAKFFLKTCILPRDKDELKIKLAEWASFRNEMITTSFDEYKSIWNFYFTCPDLVS